MYEKLDVLSLELKGFILKPLSKVTELELFIDDGGCNTGRRECNTLSLSLGRHVEQSIVRRCGICWVDER
jgi:hypothetical protein